MTKTIYMVALSLFLFLGCKKSDNKIDSEPESLGLQIEIKAVSGWSDEMNINIDQHKTEIKYPKGSLPETKKDKAYQTSEATIKQLSNYIDKYKLMEVKIQECARCTDGIDYIIKIRYEGRENIVTIAAHRTDGKYADLLGFIEKI